MAMGLMLNSVVGLPYFDGSPKVAEYQTLSMTSRYACRTPSDL